MNNVLDDESGRLGRDVFLELPLVVQLLGDFVEHLDAI